MLAMRRLKVGSALLGVLVLGVVSGAEPPPSPAGAPPAPPVIRPATPEEAARGATLVRQAVDAMGGPAVLDRLRTLRAQGLSRRKMPSGETVGIPTTSVLVFPDRYRHEVELPTIGRLTTLITGKAAYLIGPNGSLTLPEHEKFNIEDRILRNPVVLLRMRHDVFFEAIPEASDEIDKRRVDWVRIQLGQHKVTWVALDAETHRVSRVRYRERTPQGETGAEIVSSYSDFRTVKGLVYPFEATVSVAGQTDFWSRTESLSVDEPVPEALFEAPAPTGSSAER
jgi:hypothetical protein